MRNDGSRAHRLTSEYGRALLVAACALIALLTSAAAAGAVTFGSPQTVAPASESPSLSPGNSSIAMDASGDAAVVWTNGSSSTVRAAFRSAGGAFGSPIDVSAAGNAQGDARVAMDAAGDTLVAWTDATGSAEPEWNTVASFRPAGGSFSSPTVISTTSGPGMDATKGGTLAGVAMDAAGDAIVAWIPAGTNTYPRQIAYARRPASTGTFTTPADVSAGQDARRFGGLAMSPSGRAAIEFEWRADCGGVSGSPDTPTKTQHVQVARAAAGAAFGTPETVSADLS